ncbi:MAG: hypothetical protein ACK5JL_05055 [Candidatus Kapaibacterium sp.]|jgi:hypothetical protein
MRYLLLVIIAIVGVHTASAQGFGKKKSVESAATPATPVAPVPAASSTAPVAAPAAKAAKAKGWTGTVTTLIGCANGKCAMISKADAKTSVGRGELLCLCVKNTCYIILTGDGTNASSKLADLAGGNVTVTGKLLKKSGVNVILADSIN